MRSTIKISTTCTDPVRIETPCPAAVMKIVLAIELDRKSHQSEKMKKKDNFVEKLYKKIRLQFERVKVGGNFINIIKLITRQTNKNEL